MSRALSFPLSGLTVAALLALMLPASAQEPLSRGPEAGRGEAVVADLSEKLIAITSNFTGAELLLFGNVDAPDMVTPALQRDVVAVVRGPYEPLTVRRKQRVAGIWVNRDAEEVPAAPGFYHVASTRPLSEIADADVYADAQIGLEAIELKGDGSAALPEAYREAILRAKTREGLYAQAPGSITFVGPSLFRAEIALPANVPVGSYIATVYLLRDGQITNQRSINLIINKSGIERFMYNFAQKTPFFYGVASVLVALLAGWIAGTVFRER
ncbi:TIGR02186 family protein [Pyruvatibacter mobilis]|uniref:TIGR02186 family protein n=1 Tax=Pyruvatibacter mobilis TaxID=1712261 RepID=UPI003BA8CFD8